MTIQEYFKAAIVLLLSFGLLSYVRYLNHNVQFTDEGPVDAAGDLPLDPPIERDLQTIKQRGTLTVLAQQEDHPLEVA